MADAENIKRLSIIFKRCPIPRSFLITWLEVPAFESAVIDAINNGRVIDDRLVLEIMESIMPDIVSRKIVCSGYKELRRGLNQLRRAVEEQSKQPVP